MNEQFARATAGRSGLAVASSPSSAYLGLSLHSPYHVVRPLLTICLTMFTIVSPASTAFSQNEGVSRRIQSRQLDELQQQTEELRAQRTMLAEQLKEMQRQLEAYRGQSPQSSKPSPLPDDARFEAFVLKYVQAEQAAAAVRRLVGEGDFRIAFDEVQNTLLVAANEKTLNFVAQLIQTLDRPPPASPPDEVRVVQSVESGRARDIASTLQGVFGDVQFTWDSRANVLIIRGRQPAVERARQFLRHMEEVSRTEQPPAETLKVRLVWLTDGRDLPEDVGFEPSNDFLDPRVVESLDQIGFTRPRVVCQHVASVVREGDQPANFKFQVPTILEGNTVIFQGGAELHREELGNSQNYDLSLSMDLSTNDIQEERSSLGSISGSIKMPVRHYVVLGTTNMVLYGFADVPGGGKAYPTALVVYLDLQQTFSVDRGQRQPAPRPDRNSSRPTQPSGDNPFDRPRRSRDNPFDN